MRQLLRLYQPYNQIPVPVAIDCEVVGQIGKSLTVYPAQSYQYIPSNENLRKTQIKDCVHNLIWLLRISNDAFWVNKRTCKLPRIYQQDLC